MTAVALLSVALLLAPSLLNAAYGSDKTSSDRSRTKYEGVRATDVLGARVISKSGASLGRVRNIEVTEDGRVGAVIAEQEGLGTIHEFVFKLPWEYVVKPLRAGTIVADLAHVESHKFGLFLRTERERNSTFLVSQILGDYARLQTGLGYGYVKDVVFSGDGLMFAVLVARAAPEGGTIAFSYPGRTGRWDPSMSYYGLPFVTSDQADEAGVKVDKATFEEGG